MNQRGPHRRGCTRNEQKRPREETHAVGTVAMPPPARRTGLNALVSGVRKASDGFIDVDAVEASIDDVVQLITTSGNEQSDLDMTEWGSLINDNVVRSCVSSLREVSVTEWTPVDSQVVRVLYSRSVHRAQELQAYVDNNFQQHETLVMPFCSSGHWVLLVALPRGNGRTLRLWDSLPGNISMESVAILQHRLRCTELCVEVCARQEKESNDCAMHVMINLAAFSNVSVKIDRLWMRETHAKRMRTAEAPNVEE